MKNCIWLKPQLVAHIEFTEWTADKHLRHAKFWDCEMIKIPIKRRGSSGASRLLIKGATLYLATYSVAHGCGNNTPRVAARGGL